VIVRLHSLAPLGGTDTDGDAYLHEILPHEPLEGDVWCVECRGMSTSRHPLFPDRQLVESCRGLTLCARVKCRNAHLERHMRARQDAEELQRAEQATTKAGKGRRAA
jgi:hypothetical protein